MFAEGPWGREVVHGEWSVQVVREGGLEEPTVEVTVANDGILTFAIIAEENRIKLAIVLCSEPVKGGSRCIGQSTILR
jgi:hypothetical protein